MKKLFLLSALLPLAALAATSTPAGFTDDLDQALEAARADGKFVYVCFTGSDWCGWCKKLNSEVFAKSEFAPRLTNDYYLVFIDSPRNKSLLSPRARRMNGSIIKRCRIAGFPTSLVFDEKGQKILTTGYRPGGAEAYADYLLDIRKDPEKYRAETAKKEELAKKIKEALAPFHDREAKILKEMDARCEAFQKKELAEGKSADEARNNSKKIMFEMLPDLKQLCVDLEKAEVIPEAKKDRDNYLYRLQEWLELIETEKARITGEL